MTISEILAEAHQRGRAKELSYQGELLPAEAYALMQTAPGSRLVENGAANIVFIHRRTTCNIVT